MIARGRSRAWFHGAEAEQLGTRSQAPSKRATVDLTAAADGSGYFFGGALSYADIAVFHAVDAARSQFAAAFAELQCPALKAHHQKIEALPRIAAYRASARCRPFSGDSMM